MSLRPQRRRQTRQRLFTLPKPPADKALSINGNTVNASDTGFAGQMESAIDVNKTSKFYGTSMTS